MNYLHNEIIEFGFQEELPYGDQYVWVKRCLSQLLFSLNENEGVDCPLKYMTYLEKQGVVHSFFSKGGKFHATLEQNFLVQCKLPWVHRRLM